MKNSKAPKHNAKHVLAFLAWQDVMERLDTLLLEIRHLQVNIVHNLRVPELYEPIIYEEQYLWGGPYFQVEQETHSTWTKLLKGQQYKFSKLVADWIIQYPSPSEFAGAGASVSCEVNDLEFAFGTTPFSAGSNKRWVGRSRLLLSACELFTKYKVFWKKNDSGIDVERVLLTLDDGLIEIEDAVSSMAASRLLELCQKVKIECELISEFYRSKSQVDSLKALVKLLDGLVDVKTAIMEVRVEIDEIDTRPFEDGFNRFRDCFDFSSDSLVSLLNGLRVKVIEVCARQAEEASNAYLDSFVRLSDQATALMKNGFNICVDSKDISSLLAELEDWLFAVTKTLELKSRFDIEHRLGHAIQRVLGPPDERRESVPNKAEEDGVGEIGTPPGQKGGEGNSSWSLEQQRHYHNLRALQSLKRDILYDKLQICAQGLHKVDWEQRLDDNYTIAKLMIQRAAVIAKARRYVEHLGDLQGQFENAIDMAQADTPSPNLERRREQGLYTNYLSDKCRDLQRITGMLLDKMNVPAATISGKSVKSFTIHRWTHDYTSRSISFMDEVAGKLAGNSDSVMHFNLLNTSYWMPDRPDLQSTIAHEVAHGLIKVRCDDLSRQALSGTDDSFARLLRLLHHAFETFGVKRGSSSFSASAFPEYSLREIYADMLATSVEGHPYLYALFLEILGQGLENLLHAPRDSFELSSVDMLDSSVSVDCLSWDWYYRLSIAVAWMREIHHKAPPSPLDDMLVDGIELVLREVIQFLSEKSPPEDNVVEFWKKLTNRLCAITKKSDAALEVQEWRKYRSEDFGMAHLGKPGPRKMPRFTRQVPYEVRDLIYRTTLGRRRDYDEFSNLDSTQFQKQFDKKYLADKNYEFPSGKSALEKRYQNTRLESRPLFQHLYDVPWQLSLMRAIDFVGALNPHPVSSWLEELHFNAPMGREAYQVALEFLVWDVQSTYLRLRTIVEILYSVGRVSSSNNKSAKDGERDLPGPIARWLSGSGVWEEYEEILERAGEYAVALRDDKEDAVKKFRDISPSALMRRFLSAKSVTGEEARAELERLMGYKLRELAKLLFNEGGEDFSEIKKLGGVWYLEPIRTLLWIPDDYIAEAKKRGEDMGVMFRAVDWRSDSDKESDRRMEFPKNGREEGGLGERRKVASQNEYEDEMGLTRDYALYMLTQTVVAGAYSNNSQGESRIIDFSKILVSRNDNTWKERPNPSSKQWLKTPARISHALLGRYDIFSYYRVRPMCRCPLPKFPEGFETASPNPSVYFVRREMGIPFLLGSRAGYKGVEGMFEHGVDGVIAISLSQREARLDFVHRILRARKRDQVRRTSAGGKKLTGKAAKISKWPEHREDEERPRIIESVASLFGEGDVLFLSEGWDDVIIVMDKSVSDDGASENIYSLESSTRLKRVFRIFDGVENDFQVDGAELILGPQYISVASQSSDFSLSVEIRLLENRQTASTVVGVIDKLGAKLDKWCRKKFGSSAKDLGITMFRTLGRTDIEVNFPGMIGDGSKKIYARELKGLFLGVQGIDKIQTKIGCAVRWGRKP